MPLNALTHEEDRQRVCLFWLKVQSTRDLKNLNKMRIITPNGKIEERVKKFFCDYDSSRQELPTAVCNTCYVTIYKTGENQLIGANRMKFNPIRTDVRSFNSDGCLCTLCEIARKNKNPRFLKGE